MLSHTIARKYGSVGLEPGAIHYTFNGAAGQSFGAFLIRGVELSLVGSTNDYLAKGLSGGCVSLRPSSHVIYNPATNTIAGNACLYGATSGEVYIRGAAGDRFAVRNSGAKAVVEAVGVNACEYMTGGTVVVLGSYGKNFAAGMSGGVAYVYQQDKDRSERINPEMVELESCDQKDFIRIQTLLRRHFELTSSALALDILNDWYDLSRHFLKVIPTEYKKVLARGKSAAQDRSDVKQKVAKSVIAKTQTI